MIFFKNKNKNRGFTLVELIFVMAILVIMLLVAVVALFTMRERSRLDNNAQGAVNVLRLARSQAIASEAESRYGVYFDSTVSPNIYVLFRGSSYIGRNPTYDTVYQLSDKVEFRDLPDGKAEIVFSRITGAANPYGNIKLALSSDPSQFSVIYISSSGKVDLKTTSLPSSTPVTDSRHVHFNLSGPLAVSLLVFKFPDCPADQTSITFSSFLNTVQNEFSWEGQVPMTPACGGTKQKLKITTHSLSYSAGIINNAIFSVHRDRRYNNRPLQIFLDAENLINYAADGTVTQGLSSYVVQAPQIQ